MQKKTHSLYSVTLSLFFIATLPIPHADAATKTQLFKPSKAGRIATVTANTILNGTTPPSNSDGNDGDFYIDTKAMLFYGPKTKSHWPAPTNIRGPQGKTGASGSNGSDAKPGANIVAAGAQGPAGSTGPKGEQGPQGVAGPAGPKGEAGAAGPAGANGLPGANGATGPAGANGATGPAGAQGPAGYSGAQGAAGAPGSTGPVGPTGPTGAAGAVVALYGNITFGSAIQGAAGANSTSSNFGSFEAGKSYVVRVQIQTFNVDRLITAYPLSLDIAAQGASPTRVVSYLIANGSSYNLSVRRDDVSVSAEVILDGSQVASSYSLSITITCGVNTSAFPVTLLAKYEAIQVGQVTQTG